MVCFIGFSRFGAGGKSHATPNGKLQLAPGTRPTQANTVRLLKLASWGLFGQMAHDQTDKLNELHEASDQERFRPIKNGDWAAPAHLYW